VFGLSCELADFAGSKSREANSLLYIILHIISTRSVLRIDSLSIFFFQSKFSTDHNRYIARFEINLAYSGALNSGSLAGCRLILSDAAHINKFDNCIICFVVKKGIFNLRHRLGLLIIVVQGCVGGSGRGFSTEFELVVPRREPSCSK
jgi:hypothetical protein